MDGDQLNYKQQKKSLNPGGPAQLARNMPQEEHTLSERGPYKEQGMPLDSHKHQKARASQISQITCLS